jgi:hypothetical protein
MQGAGAAHSSLNYPRALGAAIHQAAPKLGLYKECLALAKVLQDPRVRMMSINEVKEKWRENRGAVGPTLELLIASTLDRLSYARLCTNKNRLRGMPDASERYDWDVRNPMESHAKMAKINKRIEQTDKPAEHRDQCHGRGKRDFVPITNWGRGNVDPDLAKKQKEQMDRQFFMGPHWRGKPKPLIYEDMSFEEQMVAHLSPAPKIPYKKKKNF